MYIVASLFLYSSTVHCVQYIQRALEPTCIVGWSDFEVQRTLVKLPNCLNSKILFFIVVHYVGKIRTFTLGKIDSGILHYGEMDSEEISWSSTSRWVCFIKSGSQKSHSTIPLKGVCNEIFDLQFFS